MSKRLRIEAIEIVGYLFPSFPGLVFHSNKFWLNEIEVAEVYNNGSLALVIHGTKKGKTKLLKQLRKEAVKCMIKVNLCPF